MRSAWSGLACGSGPPRVCGASHVLRIDSAELRLETVVNLADFEWRIGHVLQTATWYCKFIHNMVFYVALNNRHISVNTPFSVSG